MASNMLCGDEINAVVIDIGTNTTRMGFAGQDVPKFNFRSDIKHAAGKKSVGDSCFRVLDEASGAYPVSSSASKWEDLELLLRHGLERSMRVNTAEHALMFSKNTLLATQEDGRRLLELCFEDLQSPALHLMPQASLSAFSAGRPNCLVVDIGASSTSIMPVIDGYTVRRASVKSLVGGQMLDHVLFNHITNEVRQSIRPWYLKARPHLKVRGSLHMLQVFDVVRDVKHWMSIMPASTSSPENYAENSLLLPPAYELPDGSSLNASYTLSTLAEQCFFPLCRQSNTQTMISCYMSENIASRGYLYYSENTKAITNVKLVQGTEEIGSNKKRSRAIAESSAILSPEQESLTDLIYWSLSRCDADYRKELAGNVLLAGGGALIDGLDKRVNRELQEIMPSHIKVKLVSNLPVEKLNSAWIGGSALSICGSFHQLWVGRKDYEEQGAARLFATKFVH